MSQPTPYSRSTAFSDEELSNVGGRSTVRTARVDAELDAIALTLDETLANLELIQRDDGKLRDATVELHTLSSAVLALLTSYGATPRGAWVTATFYTFKDLVSQSGNTYICVTAHTSGTFATDLAAGRWLLFSLGTAIGAGAVTFAPTGTIAATDVQSAINESDTENRALSAAAQATANAALPAASAANSASAALGAALLAYNPALPYASGLGQFLNYTFARTASETAAAVTPTSYVYLPLDIRRYGAAVDNSTTDTTPITTACTVASQTVAGAQGNEVKIPLGTAVVAASINVPNRVAIVGVSKRGSVLKAASGHTGPYMLTVDNGTSSMFDNRLDRIALDCNDVAGLGGVLSDAWQEGGGLRDVLINKFRTYGVRFQNGDGGAALVEIAQAEIFGSAAAAATAGVRVDQISATGNFMLKVRDTTIAGGGSGTELPKGIDIVKDSLHCQNVHFEYVTSGVYLDGVGHHVLIGVTGGPGVTNVVEIASTFTGSLFMLGCHRAGATNLLKDNRSGGYGTVTSLDFPLMIPSSGAVIFGPGQTNSAGVFDGTVASPAVTNCYGVSSISRTATGTYTVTESRARPSANCSPQASSNLAGGRTTVDLVGTATFQIRTYDAAGTLTNSNEIKFTNTRIV